VTNAPSVSIVVPTFARGAVLGETVRRLLDLEPPASEILVVDQTPAARQEVATELSELHERGRIRWIRLDRPSIPRAMNEGLGRARGELVLFLDDDVVPQRDLAGRHAAAHAAGDAEIVVGQVLEPGQRPEPLTGDAFAFRSSVAQEVGEVIGCNFSVRRRQALEIGGFDENFVAVAYRFEAEFSERARRAGQRIRFEPAASLVHLRAPAGGVRAFGDHLRTLKPSHAVGEYYYLFASRGRGRWRRMAARPLRAVRTRHHLRRPWWIPATLVAELLGWAWAGWLRARGARTLAPGLATERPR
jgi:GT2 family glycosyltransferase